MTRPIAPPAGEQTFFTDPALDRLMGVTFRLASELHVARDRLLGLEQLLVQKGVLTRNELDAFGPDGADAQDQADQRRAYVANILSPILGEAASKS